MRAIFGSTFLIATLAGSFAAQAGTILNVRAGQTGTLAAVLAFLDNCRTADFGHSLAAASGPAAIRHAGRPPLQPAPVPTWIAAPAVSTIAGGVHNLSAVLTSIHRRRPDILRL